jgi:hypothetical protein
MQQRPFSENIDLRIYKEISSKSIFTGEVGFNQNISEQLIKTKEGLHFIHLIIEGRTKNAHTDNFVTVGA